VEAVYITAKFHSSTSISGRVIAVCAKIQDGGHHHFGFYFLFSILAYMHVRPTAYKIHFVPTA